MYSSLVIMFQHILTRHALCSADKLIAEKEKKLAKLEKAKEGRAKKRREKEGMTVSEAIEKANDVLRRAQERYDQSAKELQKHGDDVAEAENKLAALELEADAEEAEDAADAEEVFQILRE